MLHTHDYKQPSGYEDKRIVVIDIGNSAGDAAVELARCAKQVRRQGFIYTEQHRYRYRNRYQPSNLIV